MAEVSTWVYPAMSWACGAYTDHQEVWEDKAKLRSSTKIQAPGILVDVGLQKIHNTHDTCTLAKRVPSSDHVSHQNLLVTTKYAAPWLTYVSTTGAMTIKHPALSRSIVLKRCLSQSQYPPRPSPTSGQGPGGLLCTSQSDFLFAHLATSPDCLWVNSASRYWLCRLELGWLLIYLVWIVPHF